jgi:hypothetical protein
MRKEWVFLTSCKQALRINNLGSLYGYRREQIVAFV